MLHLRLCIFPVAALLVFTGLPAAQASNPPRVHPYLADQIVRAQPGEKLPVYFVVADRLGYDHWFPRVNMLPIDERRALVMAELKSHAARTQARLMTGLRAWEAKGGADRIRANWLGNFVHCRATAAAILDVAALADLEETRFNASWPVDQVVDGPTEPVPAAAPAVNSEAGCTAQGAGGAPGCPASTACGTQATKAMTVWTLGIEGQGVIAMNADTGADINHGDLVNRLWTNPGEIPGNGIDDDHNGYVDDVVGYNFFDDNNVVNSGSLSHGTMTAGCMVADGSCSGIAIGQAPRARVMIGAIGACCPQTGPVNPAGEVAQWEAVQYAIEMGAHVQTSSHSYKNGFVPPPNYKMHRDVGDNSLAAGLIRTNSSSNNGAEANKPTSLARVPFNVSSPSNLPPPYIDPHQTLVGRKGGVIGVGAHDVASGVLPSYTPTGPFAWDLDDVLAVNPSYPSAFWSSNHNDYPWAGGTKLGLIKPDITGPTHTYALETGRPCGTGTSSGTSNATPNVAGCLILWKSANMSLKPEDAAMILHQSAQESGAKVGKENGFGAGRVNALRGVFLALCTHRVNGEPAWSVDHQVGATATWEVDTVVNAPLTVIVFGSSRLVTGGTLGIGAPLAVAYAGPVGPTGEVSFQASVPTVLAGMSIFSQCFTDDSAGVTKRLLASNVIETRFLP